MSIQSPKSQRAKGPAETPASDNLSDTIRPHVVPENHAPAGTGKPTVPSMDRTEGKGHKGNVEAESAVPVGSTTPHQGGGPGFAKDTGDGMKKGGTVHQT